MTDLEVALSVALAILLMFQIAAWVQRRMGGAPSPVTIVQPPTLVDVSEPMKLRIDSMAAQLTSHDAKIGELDHDVRGLRTGIQALPTRDHVASKDTVHALQIEIAEMRGQINVIDERSEATGSAVERIENHLINKGV